MSISTEQLETLLMYLPPRSLAEYRRKIVIYDAERPPTGLCLIKAGRVKVSTTIEDGSETVLGIFGADDLFGSGVLLGENTTHREHAVSLEKTALMSWTNAEIETQIERYPRLGNVLIQLFAGRCLEFENRFQSIAFDLVPRRLVVGLIHLAKSGTQQPDGAVRIPALTHLYPQRLTEHLLKLPR